MVMLYQQSDQLELIGCVTDDLWIGRKDVGLYIRAVVAIL